jgi:hypothetical protein
VHCTALQCSNVDSNCAAQLHISDNLPASLRLLLDYSATVLALSKSLAAARCNSSQIEFESPAQAAALGSPPFPNSCFSSFQARPLHWNLNSSMEDVRSLPEWLCLDSKLPPPCCNCLCRSSLCGLCMFWFSTVRFLPQLVSSWLFSSPLASMDPSPHQSPPADVAVTDICSSS